MGNILLIRNALLRLQVLSGNIDSVPIKEKAKFPQEFFPDVSVVNLFKN